VHRILVELPGTTGTRHGSGPPWSAEGHPRPAWHTQLRLYRRDPASDRARKRTPVAVLALACEVVGFVWAALTPVMTGAKAA
jgi:hypothetical protein